MSKPMCQVFEIVGLLNWQFSRLSPFTDTPHLLPRVTLQAEKGCSTCVPLRRYAPEDYLKRAKKGKNI